MTNKQSTDSVPILQVRDATYGYDDTSQIFHNISFDVKRGESFTILGANGSGKSTLLNCISGLFRPSSGEILVDGKSVHSIPDVQRALEIAYVSQLQSLAFDFTAREYLLMGRTPFLGAMHSPGSDEYDLVDTVLEELKIGHLADKSMQRISGGERQQIQIARALVQQPKLLLLDEPTNHLDYGNQVKVLELIMSLTEERGITVVVTTHVPDQPILLNGKVGILSGSGTMRCGAASQIITEDNLKQIYHAQLHLIYIKELGRRACLMGSLSGKYTQSEPGETQPGETQ